MKRNRLVIFSSVKHFEVNGTVIAHAGFVKEIGPLLTFFEKILIVCTKSSPGLEKGDEIPYGLSNIQFHFFNPRDARGSKSTLPKIFQYYVKAFLEGSKLVEPSDVLMARGPDGIGFLPILIAKIKKTKLIGHYADQWADHETERISNRIQKYFYRSPFWFKGPIQIYGVKNAEKPNLIPFFTSGVSKRQFQELEGRISQKKKLETIISVGRLVPDKGFDLLIHAIKLVVDSLPQENLKLIIIGDGSERLTLETQSKKLGLENHVVFPGWLSYDDVLSKLLEADLFIHPSRKEGFGKVLIEAMACGLPIIASDVGVSREIFGKDYPFFFKPNDFDTLKKQIEVFLKHPEKLEVVGKNLRNRLSEKGYFLDNLLKEYEKLIDQL